MAIDPRSICRKTGPGPDIIISPTIPRPLLSSRPLLSHHFFPSFLFPLSFSLSNYLPPLKKIVQTRRLLRRPKVPALLFDINSLYQPSPSISTLPSHQLSFEVSLFSSQSSLKPGCCCIEVAVYLKARPAQTARQPSRFGKNMMEKYSNLCMGVISVQGSNSRTMLLVRLACQLDMLDPLLNDDSLKAIEPFQSHLRGM